MLYALITAAAVLRYEDFADPPPELPAAKGLYWLPVTDVIPEPGAGETLTGPDVAVTNDAVTRTWRTVAAPPPPVPAVITPLQMRSALRVAGLIDQVEAAVVSAGPAASDAWEYAIEIRRNSPLIDQIGEALGLSAAQVDDLFITAISC